MAANIFAEIFTLSKTLASWQNEAIRRLFTKGTLSEADKAEIFQEAQVEYSFLPPLPEPPNLMLRPTDLPTPPQPGQKIKLKGLREAANVNALKSNQHLAVGDQLTIIYGDNASGKSGYARIMKKAFRARAVDPVLPNVYVKASTISPASAIFEIEENGKVRDEKWVDGKDSPACLGRFAVFDGKCARVYISENNQLRFLPYGFDIIGGLAAVTSDIKKRFQELALKTDPKPDALKMLVDDTPTGNVIGSISASTNEEDIKARAVWSDADSGTLITKEVELAKLKANSPQNLRDSLSGRRRQIVTVRDTVERIAGAISEEMVADIKAKVSDLAKFEKAVEAAAKATFEDLEVRGIGGEVWRELLVAAAKFSTKVAYAKQPFPAPEAGSKCVLCLQPLDVTARERLTRFWAFIQEDVSNKRNEAKIALALEAEKLVGVPRQLPKEIEILEETLRAAGSSVFEKAKIFYASVIPRIAAIENAVTTNAWDSISSMPISPTQTCEDEIAAIDMQMKSVVDDAQISSSIAALTAEVAELNARKRLKANLPHVLDHLNALKAVAKANGTANKITTNAISLKAAELQTKFVTDAFRRRVEEELKPLNLPRVKAGIDKKSEKGKVLHRLTVDGVAGVAPESGFSEGERTALSLSCFLAELGASDDNCGIIFDDPVSSLDHRIREAIVKRLVKEAATRQVIIFTHDLVCYREMFSAAEHQNLEIQFQNVEALGGTTGILTNVPPPPAQKVGQRVIRLEQVLREAKDAETVADPVAYRAAFREFYDLLRSTWERSVEEVLFNQVVQRLEREVKTMRLVGVYVDSDSVSAVFEGMTRSSEMVEAHDHSVAQNTALPPSSDLSNDLEKIKAFMTSQKAKIKAAETQNAYLKA